MKPGVKIFLVMIFPTILLSGCYYYQPVSLASEYKLIKSAHDERRVFILHYNDSVWLLTKVLVYEKDRDLTGTLEALPSDRKFYQLCKPDKSTRLRKGNLDPEVEVHLYVSNLKYDHDGFTRIPVSDIFKIETYSMDRYKTRLTHTLAIGGAVIGLVTIIFAVIMANFSLGPIGF